MPAVFRTILVQEGEALHLQEHLDRLYKESLTTLPSINEITAFIHQKGALQGNWRLRIIVDGDVTLSIEPYQSLKRPYRVIVYPDPCPNLKVKSLAFLERTSLLTWAQERGCDEVLTVNEEGYILEGAFCNCFWEEDEVLYFVDPSLPYYEGVTQERIIKETHKKVRFAKITAEQLQKKRLYLCSSLKGVIPSHF